MIRTRLCDLLGIEVPILSAPMGGGPAGARLAAAVSEGGGLGLIGGTTERGAAWLRSEIEQARALTSKPFGVGFISHFPSVHSLLSVADELGVPVVAHSFADPSPFVAGAHARGAIVICQVQNLDDARRAADAGVDVIVAQGTEAGGHTGTVATFPLIPAVVDLVAPIPVVAAGGIADARGIAAALLLGAEGVWMGTRFLATPESGATATTKERIVGARTGDTVLTEVFDLAKGAPWPAGVLGRSIRNAFTEQWHGHEEELRQWGPDDRRAYRAAADGDAEKGDLYAGESVGFVHGIEPAADLVRRLAAETEAVLRDRTASLIR